MTFDVPTLSILAPVAFAAVIGYAVATFARRRPFRRTTSAGKSWNLAGYPRLRAHFHDVGDAANQLRIVMAAPFAPRKVMGVSEYRVFRVVEDEVAGWRSGHRVFAQTSLGEILTSPDRRAYLSINSKRLDILVIAPDGYPLAAVEYHGSGHHQKEAAARDAVKKEALRKAGVHLIEVVENDAPDDVRRRVRQACGRGATPPSFEEGPGKVTEFARRKA